MAVISTGPLRISCAAPRLSLYDRPGNFLSCASGAFARVGSCTFLVTNWHVLSGCNQQTGHCLSPSGATPHTVEVHYQRLPDGVTAIPHTVRLPVVDEGTGTPLWFEHPQLGRAADSAALRIPNETFSSVYVVNNDVVWGTDGNPLGKQPLIFEGTEVYILGYPRGISAGENLPVWKRASIASALGIPIDGSPKFLVDSATSEGLSGSPVIFRSNIFFVEGPAGLLGALQTAVGGTAQVFLGIYSGRDRRLIDTEAAEQITAQLGYVWNRSCVDELLAHAAGTAAS